MRKILVPLLMASLLIASCATSKLQVSESEYSILEQDVVMMEMGFEKRELPLMPLIDAGIYNAATSKAQASFEEIEKEKAIEISDFYNAEMSSLMGKEIKTTPSIFSKNNLPNLMEPNADVKESIKSLLDDNDADYVLIPTIRVISSGVAAFGLAATSYIKSYIYIYDDKGEYVADGFFQSKGVRAGPTNEEAYKEAIDEYKPLAPELMNLMIH